MTMSLLALTGAMIMLTLCITVFTLWLARHFPFNDSCLARAVLFTTGFAAGFLGIWTLQPDNLTNVICLGPVVGLGVGGYAGILMPTIVQRPSRSPKEK